MTGLNITPAVKFAADPPLGARPVDDRGAQVPAIEPPAIGETRAGASSGEVADRSEDTGYEERAALQDDTVRQDRRASS